MLQVIPTSIIEAEINDATVRLRVSDPDVVKLTEILKFNNAKSISIRAEDWKHWPQKPLGTFPKGKSDDKEDSK